MDEQPLSPDEQPEVERKSARETVYELFLTLRFYVYTFLLVVLLGLGFLWPRMFITVPAGHHAVMYRYFEAGTVTDRIWGEGFHVIPPWDTLTVYESRLQQKTLRFSVLSDEGLDLEVVVSVRYRPHRNQLGLLHQDIGPNYFERLIKPEVEAHVRRTFGNRPAHEIYSSSKDVLQELRNIPMITRIDEDDADDAGAGGVGVEVREAMQDLTGELPGELLGEPVSSTPELGYIDVQEIKLMDINLPEIVKAAIADKYRQEQLKLEYIHRIAREEQEAERKRIEAAGIRDYNSIVSEISPALLRWRDIEATRELAKSPNAKVVVLGQGGGQTPLLFSLGDAPEGPDASQQRADDGPSDALPDDGPLEVLPEAPTDDLP
ncbi:Membrane protease subunit stomatin/prohibitin-like protein [Plesiocystis pacifica SIR-1]|uniref:Membrane protease subunit stomatin/prohibitin-like protein n=1 Tax=Plesiocystis pacifica SIR-1 TaxID=391625 RepID=A6G7G5_9BACT|nr:prohibitin family protein [Plesiocystis pacifica]EDM78174.1 Membrane protease subunit stomatin/prohibitin-like protein [Plesiocystis pacifica SIR-1]